jgi:two-component system response regulator YesN
MKEWIIYVVNKVIDYIYMVEESQSIAEKVKAYIDRHIDTELNRNEIANYVYLSPDYLTKVFKKETGIPLSQYIIQERIKKAKYLLSATKIPIRDVAMSVGCENISYFSKLFKKYEDISPYEFRQANSEQIQKKAY